ncbi:hypothetical protein BN2537_2061 [Streptomyces venezuelae]|nr:hypothetical protein BN2537_2061 [Streptomyces venezuelae]
MRRRRGDGFPPVPEQWGSSTTVEEYGDAVDSGAGRRGGRRCRCDVEVSGKPPRGNGRPM